jgi:hypothetical protein
MTQTTNPKRAGEVWNKPKASTYSSLIALWVDDKDFIDTDSIYDLGYYDLKRLEAWGERNQALIQADEYVRNKFEAAVASRKAYEERKAKGEVKLRVTTTEYVPGQGLVQTKEETITVE